MERRPTDDVLYRTAYRDRIDRNPMVPGYVARADIKGARIPGFIYSGKQHPNYDYITRPDSMREQFVRNLQTTTSTDRMIGRLREQLRTLGELENTIFVFTSDQGILYGEWGYGGKCLLYEPSIRVPLIIHDPRLGAARSVKVDQLAVMPDLAPTILDLCGIAPGMRFQGSSLIPLLRGNAAGWREDFFLECQMNGQDYPIMHGVAGTRWKYIRYYPLRPQPKDYRELLNLGLTAEQPAYEELFDLAADPEEARNLAADPIDRGELERLRERCRVLQLAALDRAPSDPLPSGDKVTWKADEQSCCQASSVTR